MQIYKDPTDEVSPFLAEKYDREAARYWDKFYGRNGANFFKDRHYLENEFPELCKQGIVLLEVGCGAGNTVYPLLERHPDMRIFACDFSPKAVELVNTHERYDPERVTAFVADITQDYPFDLAIEPGSVDIVTMVFVLSAITPEKMQLAISNIARVLKPGGRVLLRDYAKGDLAQVRLAQDGKQQRISEDFYVRGDGTCAYYFGTDELQQLFEMHGLRCVNSTVHERQLENRKKDQVMDRRWIQAVFQRRERAAGSSISPAAIRFTGAAGRLASNRPSSTAAVLPDSLDPADIIAGELSPGQLGSVAAYEAELEREFANLVGRDTEEVVAEEISLMDARGSGRWRNRETTVLLGMEEEEEEEEGDSNGGTQPRFWGINPADLMMLPPLEPIAPAAADDEADILEVSVAGCAFRLNAAAHPHRSSSSSSPASAFQPHSGVTVLGADPLLARFVGASPEIFTGSRVLHLWCRELPLCAMTALRTCRRSVAAVRDPSQLSALRANARLNSSNFVFERLHCCDAAKLLRPAAAPLALAKAALPAPPPEAYDVVMCSWDALSRPGEAREAAARVLEAAGPLLEEPSSAAVVLLGLMLQSEEHLEAVEAAAEEAGFQATRGGRADGGGGPAASGPCVLCLRARS